MIETIIQQRLAGLAGGRVYGGVAPDPVQRPYITHFHVGGELGMAFCGPDGSDSGSVQIDCWPAAVARPPHWRGRSISAWSHRMRSSPPRASGAFRPATKPTPSCIGVRGK